MDQKKSSNPAKASLAAAPQKKGLHPPVALAPAGQQFEVPNLGERKTDEFGRFYFLAQPKPIPKPLPDSAVDQKEPKFK